ncbi:MAG: hypothetical protein COB14_00670 [Alphaproteobacteria bacterium]|nr:MAG: hypothetical protein COB14_00670 [Alphaproteobacteria bacterium]
MKNISKYILISFLGLISVGIFMPEKSFGQDAKDTNISYEDVSYYVHVVDSMTLISGETKISLWGIEKMREGASVFQLKIRGVLEKEVGGQSVLCTIKSRDGEYNIKAQCINAQEEDLSLFLLQQGYASADRTAIYGSVYEHPYLNAEESARLKGQGAWADDVVSLSGDAQSKNFMMGAFFLMTIFMLALGFLGFYIMRGFGRVVDIQNQSIDLAVKERALKNKEKYIVASIIDAEVKANKSKIDAYLLVYEEVLQRLSNKDIAPNYQKTGEIIQKQPVLDRSVFDGNTDKLDSFGARLASDVIHYYARIKTVPDYVEVTPDMPRGEVIETIRMAVENAQKMNEISDMLVEGFVQHALIKHIGV